jgi:hypothetical protein
VIKENPFKQGNNSFENNSKRFRLFYFCVLTNKIYTMEQQFMMIFRMAPSNEQPTPEQLQQMEQAWGAFFGSVGANMVSTHHLGFSGATIAADQSSSNGFHVADGHMVAGNLVVKAESMEAALELAKLCPILHAGGTVEVRDIMPM